MILSEKVKKNMEELSKISDMLYVGDTTGLIAINNVINETVSIINYFISAIPYLNNLGLDIPKEVVEMQIKNLEDGLKNKDCFMLADTLKYEINDTLAVVCELISEGVIKDEQLL